MIRFYDKWDGVLTYERDRKVKFKKEKKKKIKGGKNR